MQLSMQFGTGNFDESDTKGTLLSPIAAGSKSYKYKKKEELPETSIAGIKLDPRVRALAVLSTLAVIPIFPVAIFVSTPGSGASPFKFLDFLFPPAIEGKKKREAAAGAAAAKAKAGKK